MDTRPYDIVVYGASGFTGQYVAAEVARTCNGKKMAIAGRNLAKLEDALKFVDQEVGGDFNISDVGIVIADSNDEDTIMEMCRQCRVVVNCVGPFRWYGEQVVRNCVQMATHYVDISGEPEFLQKCQIKYHNEAKSKHIHIVGACGFDSIPADVGLEILREKFPGKLTAAESFIHVHGPGKGNYGTYNTIIQSLAGKSEVKAQQREIFKGKRLPHVGSKLTPKGIGFSKSEDKWFVPFKGADPSVVRRTQLYESTVYGKTPVQYNAYFTLRSFLYLVGTIMFALNMFFLTKFSLGIKLLQRFPGFFSFGVFSKDGVCKEDLCKSGFTMVFHGKGYNVKEESEITEGEPDQSLSLKFIGPDAGYIFTSMAVVAAASTLLDDNLLNDGGVLTAASAFSRTGYVDRLIKRGVKIEVI